MLNYSAFGKYSDPLTFSKICYITALFYIFFFFLLINLLIIPHHTTIPLFVLLEGEPSPQSEVFSALQQVFIKDLSVLCSVQLSTQSLPLKNILTA